mgnify:CR=1 FL=1
MHWLLVPAAYGLGSVSFSLLLVRRIGRECHRTAAAIFDEIANPLLLRFDIGGHQ